MESVLIDFVVLGVLFGPILIITYFISRNDPRNNWDEENLTYGMVVDRELTPDLELEAEKKRHEKIRSRVILVFELVIFTVALVLAIMCHSTKAIITVVVGTLISTGVQRAILHTANEEG